MTKRLCFALGLLLVGLPPVCFGWMGKVVAIDYADQLSVRKRLGLVEHVRLYGIDSPIHPQPYGRTAKFYTMKRVLGKVVDVRPFPFHDRYNRVQAWVFVDGECLNIELVRKGLAWWYSLYFPWELELKDLQEEARKNKVGLWARPTPIPPWEFQRIRAGTEVAPALRLDRGTSSRNPAQAASSGRGKTRKKIVSGMGERKQIVGRPGSIKRRVIEEMGGSRLARPLYRDKKKRRSQFRFGLRPLHAGKARPEIRKSFSP